MCPIMQVTSQARQKKQKMESRKAASEEVRLQMTAKNRQRGCRRDVRRQTVPNTCSSDWKSTIANVLLSLLKFVTW